MAINLKLVGDEVYGYELVSYVNNNTMVIQEQLNLFLDIIDTGNKSIVGIESLTVNKGGNSNITDVLISTNGSGNFGGNLVVNNNIQSLNLTVQDSITLNNGGVTSRNVNVYNDFRGSLNVDKAFVLGSSNDDPMPMEFNSLTKLTNIVGFETKILGKISVKTKSVAIMDFRGRNVSNTNDWLNLIRLDTADIKPGHQLKVYVLLPTIPIATDTYKICNGRLTVSSPLSIANIPQDAAVEFLPSNGDWQSATFTYIGNNWKLDGLFGGARIQLVNN